MGLEGRLVDRRDALETEPFAKAWNEMPTRRGIQADVFDSHAWVSAWCDAASPEQRDTLRIPAVMDGDRPVAVLPLVAKSARRWDWLGLGSRLRYRPVIGTEAPDDSILDALAEAVACAGARELSLLNLPSRDPVVRSFAGALGRAGYFVALREGSSECLATVDDGWAAHKKRFKRYDRTVKSKSNKLKGLGELTVTMYGSGGEPIADGFAHYADLHAKSWKGEMSPSTRSLRQSLLTRTAELGWSRVFILDIAGVAAAAHVWFRVGDVATWLSTAYDQRLAVTSPGTILMWRAQERIFDESTPRIVDFLPGRNPQKDQLGPDREPLLSLEAAKKSLVTGITFPLKRQLRRAARRARRYLPNGKKNASDGPATTPARPTRSLTTGPGGDPIPASPLKLDAVTKRYLAVAGGFRGTDDMAEHWEEGDSWWRIGETPTALIRLGGEDATPRVVREIVLLDDNAKDRVDTIIGSLASETGGELTADLPAMNGEGTPGEPIKVYQSVLPWPG